MASVLRVGFVGLGNMGRPMARNLQAAGFTLQVYDAEPGKGSRFASECGGTAAANLVALGRESDVVVTMLPSGRDVRAVVLGDGARGGAAGGPGRAAGAGAGAGPGAEGAEGPAGGQDGVGAGALAAGLRRGAVIVDMSSSDPVGTRELGAELARRGVALIDAPVSGLVPRAEAGTLTIMMGADDEEALEAVRPLLERLGERLIRVGSLGCGHAMKALNNVVAATAFTVTAEALIVGKRFGLDPAVMTRVLDLSTGRSFHSAVTFPEHVLTRRFASGFTLGLLAKDVGIAGDLGAALEANTPVIDLVRRLWAEGRDEVGPREDNSAIVKRWERLNAVVLEPGRGDRRADGTTERS